TLQHLAHEDGLDLLRLHSRALDRRLDGDRPQARSRQARRTLECADGRPRGADDHHLANLALCCHATSPWEVGARFITDRPLASRGACAMSAPPWRTREI